MPVAVRDGRLVEAETGAILKRNFGRRKSIDGGPKKTKQRSTASLKRQAQAINAELSRQGKI